MNDTVAPSPPHAMLCTRSSRSGPHVRSLQEDWTLPLRRAASHEHERPPASSEVVRLLVEQYSEALQMVDHRVFPPLNEVLPEWICGDRQAAFASNGLMAHQDQLRLSFESAHE